MSEMTSSQSQGHDLPAPPSSRQASSSQEGAPLREGSYQRAMLPPADLGSIERLTLALMRLTAWKSDAADREDGRVYVRSWKGYSFWALGRLADAGLIRYKSDYKTVLLTDAGQTFSERSLETLGLASTPLETRGLPTRSSGHGQRSPRG
jgi:hypothetical protein